MLRNSRTELLKNLPVELLPVVATRAALRGLPAVAPGIHDSNARREAMMARAVVPACRALALARLRILGHSDDTSLAIATAEMLQDMAVPEDFEVDEILKSAASAVLSTVAKEPDEIQSHTNWAIGHAYAPFGPQGYDGHIHTNQAIRDAEARAERFQNRCLSEVRQNSTPLELLGRPLWFPDGIHNSLKRNVLDLISLKTTDLSDHWGVWIDWYQSILDGRPVPGDDAFYVNDATADRSIDPETANLNILSRISDQSSSESLVDQPGPSLAVSLSEFERASHAFAEVDFRYAADANGMEMVPFEEDLSSLEDDAERANLAEVLDDQNAACTELAEDIATDQRQVPKSLTADLKRYAIETARGVDDFRPGRLHRLGNSLVGDAADYDMRYGLGDRLALKIDQIASQHVAIETTFLKGMLDRMAPLAEATLKTEPEEADKRIESTIDEILSDRWQGMPQVPEELLETVKTQRAILKEMAAKNNLKPEGDDRAKAVRTVEEGYITLSATVAQFMVRSIEVVGDTATGHKSVAAGSFVIVSIIGVLASLLSLFS